MNQETGVKRNIIDKFYTKKEIVKLCFEKIVENLSISKDDTVIEPSAGNGSFIEKIKEMCDNPLFYDLKPEHKDIKEQDYLKLDYRQLQGKKFHVIGNPPFGRQSSLAIKFIKVSCKFCDSISFILPKSFKKDSMKKHFDSVFHNILELDLPINSFIIKGKEYNVPCVFQIWVKKDFDRPIKEKIKPKGYIFVKKEESPDISIRRVGVYTGRIDREIESKSIQSHYFIKFNYKIEDYMIRDLKLESADYTVGPKSISKAEIIKELNSRISSSPI